MNKMAIGGVWHAWRAPNTDDDDDASDWRFGHVVLREL